MKYPNPIKQFFGVTVDNQVYHFFINESDKKIYCCEFGLEHAGAMIEIKPNFVLRNGNPYSSYSLKDYLREHPEKTTNYHNYDNNQQPALVQNYIIEPCVLEYLLENNMIFYSYDMAMLYNLNPNYAYDNRFKTNAFKRQRYNKTKILSKQKKGIFN